MRPNAARPSTAPNPTVRPPSHTAGGTEDSGTSASYNDVTRRAFGLGPLDSGDSVYDSRTMPSRALVDLSESELRDALRKQAEHVIYSYSDLLHELDRRATLRLTRAALVLAATGVGIGLLALGIALMR